MKRIIFGIILLLFFFVGLSGNIVRGESDLIKLIFGGTIIYLIPGVLLIYFGLRSRKKDKGSPLSKTRQHTITTKKQITGTEKKKKPGKKRTPKLVIYRESKPGILDDARKQFVKMTLKSLKSRIQELESTKSSSQYVSYIDSLIIGYDDNCYSGIIGIVCKLPSDISTESFSNWASHNLFKVLEPTNWDLEYRGETTLNGFRGDFNRCRIVSLEMTPEKYKKTDEDTTKVPKTAKPIVRSTDKKREPRLRDHIESKIRFGPDTTVLGIENFNPANEEHRAKVVERIVDLAVEVYGGSGPSLASHRQLEDSWWVQYKTRTGDVNEKNYISPIEVLSPFESSAIEEVEIIHAGSGS